MLIHILFVGYQNGRRFAFHADFGRNPQDKDQTSIKKVTANFAEFGH